MKILRTIGILALVAGLVLGGAGSAFAQEPPDDEPPDRGPHSPGKRHGFFGTVGIVGIDLLTLTTAEGWTVTVTLPDTTKYMIPRVTRGPVVGLAAFESALGASITTIKDRRIAVLATNVVEEPTGVFTGEAVRLMLIPSPDSPPLHRHRVGVVQAFTAGKDGKIIIVDEDGVSHEFGVSEATVYRPAKIDPSTEIVNGESVTVVTKGGPKAAPIAKAIVLHKPEE